MGICNTPGANFIILKDYYQGKYNKADIKKEEREMIYTSYFAKIKELENNNIIPIAICAKLPGWYKGLQYKKLAPKYGFFMEWKKTHDNGCYTEHFQLEVLGSLDITSVLYDLADMLNDRAGQKDIALICYEKPTDFCHRHLVAGWLKENGTDCTEWGS